jgi:HlyD family secretion protein
MDDPSLPRLPLEHNGKAMPPAGRHPEASRYRRWRAWPARFLLAAIVCGVAGAVAFGLAERKASQSTISPPPDAGGRGGSQDVVALGRLMPQGDLVHIAPPFGSGDARIAALLVREGEAVTAGTVIAELDSLAVRRAAVAAAEANLAAHQSALEKARSNVDSSLRETAAELARARSAADLAASQADRQRALFGRQLVARAALEEAESNAIRAARERDRAEAQWGRQQGHDNQPDVALAITQLEVARQTLQEARVQLAGSYVAAPFDGTLITLHARVGERVGADGIASFGNLAQMEAELEVYQTDIARVAVGQQARLTSPALATPILGTVKSVGLQVERQSVLSSNPAANTDARVVRVRVAVDDADRDRAARLSGLDVTARLSRQP